jgi:hypothetical protein
MCVRSCAPSESGTLRPRLFLIRCGTGTGGGIRLRCAARAIFGSGSGATDAALVADVRTSDVSSSSDAGSFLAAHTFFVAAGASSSSLFSSRFFLLSLDCMYMGHLRRKRAGTRVGLRGGTEAEKVPEDGRSEDDDVGDSVGSAYDVREDGLSVVEEETVDSRAVVVEEAAPNASSPGLFSMRKCNRGKSRRRATRPWVGWAAENKVGFIEQSSDIATLKNTQSKRDGRLEIIIKTLLRRVRATLELYQNRNYKRSENLARLTGISGCVVLPRPAKGLPDVACGGPDAKFTGCCFLLPRRIFKSQPTCRGRSVLNCP